MKVILIIVVVLVALGLGGFLVSQNQNTDDSFSGQSNNSPDTTKPRMIEGYQGDVLAGTTTPFLDFNQADYQKALADGKIVFLNFYANWCPICRAEQPDMFEGFNSLSLENVVGFQVNFKDDQTDSIEEELAKQFQIPYQHTKVILVDGEEVFKETAQWDKEDLVETLRQYSN